MLILKRFLIVFSLFLSHQSSDAQQVFGVSYYMEYDPSTCYFDCHIIIDEGWATFAPYRTQFGASYTIVVPTGSPAVVAESYMPLKTNQGYGGTIPAPWNAGSYTQNVEGLGIDYYTVSPNLGVSSQYNDLAEGDTIKIFSMSISNLQECGQGVRLFENGVDINNVNGGDWSNGFTIGGTSEDFQGVHPVKYSTGPNFAPPAIISEGVVSIDLDSPTGSCSAPYTFAWTGPDGYMSSNEDVLIDPATSSNYGTYQVIIEDGIQCRDTMTMLVEGDSSASESPDVTDISIRFSPTFEHIAIHADIVGDSDLDSELSIRYRMLGASEYFDGAVTMRAHPELIIDGSALEMNFHAGSAMHLLPYTDYEVEVTLTDPDGGSMVVTEVVSTKAFPSPSSAGVIRYVVPGNGGGDGSQGNPYLGLQAAADAAVPGDIFTVADGSYSPFTLSTAGEDSMPIVFKATNLHGAVIDGMDTSNGVIVIGTHNDSIAHTAIDGFVLQNGRYGVDAQNTQHLSIQNNRIIDVDYGIVNRREHGWEHDQYFYNNEIIGRTVWPQLNGAIPAERGIDVRGNRNVISHNSVSYFGDGISTDGPASQVSYALDIHNNNVFRVVDDLIEVDGTISNTRVYSNQGFDGRVGVSLAPIYGGPAYVFRNVFYGLESSTFKMNNGTSGLVMVHNSSTKTNRGMTSPAGWKNTIFQNNLIMSEHYVYEEYGLVPGSIDDWDHNAYYSERIGNAAAPWFKWDGVQYADVSTISGTGITESSSISTSLSDLVSISIPGDYGTPHNPSSVDFNPSQGSSLINSGVDVENINSNMELSGLPDVGALEAGIASPQYGHDFAIVCDILDLDARLWIGAINVGWFHPQNWSPCGVPARHTTVTISSAADRYPSVNRATTIGDLNITGTGTLDLLTSINLILTGE